MKKFGISLVVVAVAAMVSSVVIAQPPGGGVRPGDGERRGSQGQRSDGPPSRREGDRDGGPPPRRDGGRGGESGRGGEERGFGPPPNPVMMALDADGDHIISAAEIKNAARALAKLDKNKDGKLTQDELRPDGPPSRDGEGGRGGQRGRPGEGGRGGEGGRPGNADEFLDRVMSFDENKDGKISRKEMPERMQRMLDRGDTNKDGALDRDELKKMFESFQGGRGGQGSGGQGSGRPQRDGDRPTRDGDRPPRDDDAGGGGQRPKRPAAEE